MKHLLPSKASGPWLYGKGTIGLFVEAVLWIFAYWQPVARSAEGILGRWHSTYMRFARWCGQWCLGSVWPAFLGSDADMEHLFIDSHH
jgi:hypothetical protein